MPIGAAGHGGMGHRPKDKAHKIWSHYWTGLAIWFVSGSLLILCLFSHQSSGISAAIGAGFAAIIVLRDMTSVSKWIALVFIAGFALAEIRSINAERERQETDALTNRHQLTEVSRTLKNTQDQLAAMSKGIQESPAIPASVKVSILQEQINLLSSHNDVADIESLGRIVINKRSMLEINEQEGLREKTAKDLAFIKTSYPYYDYAIRTLESMIGVIAEKTNDKARTNYKGLPDVLPNGNNQICEIWLERNNDWKFIVMIDRQPTLGSPVAPIPVQRILCGDITLKIRYTDNQPDSTDEGKSIRYDLIEPEKRRLSAQENISVYRSLIETGLKDMLGAKEIDSKK
jgi:hypothetical protein